MTIFQKLIYNILRSLSKSQLDFTEICKLIVKLIGTVKRPYVNCEENYGIKKLKDSHHWMPTPYCEAPVNSAMEKHECLELYPRMYTFLVFNKDLKMIQ